MKSNIEPPLTIQVVTWNSAKALRETLPSWQEIDRTQAIVRIIDNASTDDSVALVKQFLPDADIVQLSFNSGFAGGHNTGFARCTTPFVLVLNPDVELQWPGVQKMLAYMKDGAVGALQGKLYREGTVIDSVGIIVTTALNGRERGAGAVDHGQYNEVDRIDAVTGACALYRVAALQAVAHPHGEIFDNDFWAYKEDVDLSWRLRRAGWTILYVPVTVGTHKRSLRTESKLGWPVSIAGIWRRLRDPRVRYSWRNWLWTITKNATPPEVLTHSPGILGRGIVLLALSALYWPAARVWWETIAGLPKMIAKRRISV